MADTSIEMLAIFRNYLKLGFKAAEATHRIQEVEWNGTVSDPTAQSRSKHFKGGNFFPLEIKPRNEQP